MTATPGRRLRPWVGIAALVVLAGAGATASALAAPTGVPSPPGATTGGGVASSGTVVASSGSTVATEPPPGPTTTTTVIDAPAGTLVLDRSAASRSYLVRTGQLVQVVLPGTGAPYRGFTVPRSDGAAVQPDGRPCGARAGSFCTEFLARSTGGARLTSSSDPACRAATPPCLLPTILWTVTFSVR